MDYDSAVNRNGAQTPAAPWRDLEDTMLVRTQTHKDTSCAIPLIENTQKRQTHRQEIGERSPGSGGGNGGQ